MYATKHFDAAHSNGQEHVAARAATQADADIPAAETKLHGLMGLGLFSRAKELLSDMSEKQKTEAINSRNTSGETLAIVASRKNNLEAFQWLISNGANPSAEDPKGRTAAGWAISKGYQGILDVLDQVSYQSPAPTIEAKV